MKLKFQPSGEGVDQVLGELESRVMRLVWDNPGATARETYNRLGRPKLAYTTIFPFDSGSVGKGTPHLFPDDQTFGVKAVQTRDGKGCPF